MCGRCENCEYYVYEESRSIVSNGPNKRRICFLTIYRGDDTDKSIETLARAEDAEGYYAALYVKPNFGCVQFKQNT
jgi:hypothetical protein